ncbi:hypothetical protein QYE76_046376 [Lolium multiflorum]|uniref:DUF4220 domain-containing protein n=1 Tax=Lolium multiflorum TaxID=4521 RepID=A0AAD8TPE7_LOLMU|nr:hypothetical protein QYE76_046376 [Lolium multiflorum]
MAGVGAMLANLLIKWDLDTYILLRIRVVMGFLLVLHYVALGFLVVPLNTSRVSWARVLDAMCDMLLVYVMGAMQAAPFKNEMFPIWAVLLVSSRSCTNFMSKYDAYFELRNMLKLWAAALLNVRHGSKSSRASFWFFWGMLVIKILYRIRARKLTSNSFWHGRSSELVLVYMGSIDHNLSNFNLDTLEGCKYLVYGESKKNITKGLSPSISDLKSVIGLDNIWLHDGSLLLHIINERKNTVKDLTLAFALSRLLRCRMDGGRLHEDTISMTRELICSRITRADDNVDRVLAGILLMDLSFLGQHIHTGYPMVFCQGLRSLYLHALQCVVQLTCLVWLLVDIFPHYNTDVLITVPTVAVILGMKMFEAFSCISSNWTLLLLVCNYVSCRNNKRMEHVFERMISSILGFKEDLPVSFSSRYDFLQSSNYSEGKLRVGPLNKHLLAGRSIRRTRCNTVIAAVIRALARYMDEEGSRLPRHCLPSPRVSDRAQCYWSACLQLPTCAHLILVWHIATSLCQVKLEQDRGYTNNSGLFRFFVRNTRPDLAGNFSKANTVANCLSRYCLDLLISKPNLLPENIFASKKLLLDTIQHANDLLRSCNSPQSKYDELVALSQAVPAGSRQDIELSGNILIQGAMMGKKLIDSEDEESRWEILAEVWADILIQIAPSSKAEAHGMALQFGAELVTLVWALLCHCGIEKSELWPEEQ